jgi:uncharacterized LabA/DUF88 family protein
MNNDKGNPANIVYVFIDASNLWQAQKAKGKFFDYEKLKQCLKERFKTNSIEVFYYTAYPKEGTREYSLDSKHKFFTFLKRGLKFTVRKKELKRISVITEAGEATKEKGNMDVEMTIDAMHFINEYDTAIFFTGDAVFLALVSYIRRRGKRVYIFSSRNNVSLELRTGSDGYFDVLIIPDDMWGRDLQRREK